MIARTLSLLALFVALVLPSLGAARTAEETNALATLAEAFSKTKTMAGEFIQFNPDGGRTEGKFYIAKPGKVHFQYAGKSKLAVVSDGDQVLVHDKRLQTYDLYPLSKTPLKLLLDDAMNLARSEKVQEVRVEPDLIEVTIVDNSKFGAGRVVLIFDRTSSELRQWTVTDQQGLTTSVTLYNVALNENLPGKLFKIDYAAATMAARERRSTSDN